MTGRRKRALASATRSGVSPPWNCKSSSGARSSAAAGLAAPTSSREPGREFAEQKTDEQCDEDGGVERRLDKVGRWPKAERDGLAVRDREQRQPGGDDQHREPENNFHRHVLRT